MAKPKVKAAPAQAGLFAEAECGRCHVPLRVAGPGKKDAQVHRLAKTNKGLCVNCATHDFLRSTYPVNMLLDQSGPQGLLHPHIQQQFAAIMRTGGSDASPEEISWETIVRNWELPWGHKAARGPANPYDPERDRNPERDRKPFGFFGRER